MSDLTGILVPIGTLAIIFWGIHAIISTLKEAKIRSRLIELGHLETEKQWILEKRQQANDTYANLKYGIILLCLGAGFVLIQDLDMYHNSSLIFGIIALLAGVGFLLYFALMKYFFKKAD
ncbi:hypothetical protein GCM10027275_40840 [Rhabdobacter roseus]|uniref:DUF6249 domain-containing protein n=1 Tax=Rhabdobacter roseus TaxID=1655419 RepID=A0A840U104_9BACT|nr:DUF6249 domain-containing protein [Rhabdobacter roseus]MBB5286058.1 hypothetical protein [Rhabdobacter roseus]